MKKKSRAFSMKKQSLKKGGKAIGPDHSEGGIEVRAGSRPVAEIEGDERVFSKEDTEKIEEAAAQIQQYSDQGMVEDADQAAMRLGYDVAGMIIGQDMNQAKQEREDQAINSFSYGEDD